MTLIKSEFICQKCEYSSAKWMGKCNGCSEWNTFIESKKQNNKKNHQVSKNKRPKKCSEIKESSLIKIKTGIQEFDRVIGEGITQGSLTLIGGEPGIGKSTLLMEVCRNLSNENVILYVSGEESELQVAGRAKRLRVTDENFYILNETSWQNIIQEIKVLNPKYIVIDSIQTTLSYEISSPAGSLTQIREVTFEIMNLTKTENITAFIVGHVTKEGQLAGPKILEHMVDSVIYFEGEQYGQYRILRAIKNRFGNTNEVGVFEMNEKGLKEITNPSACFLNSNHENSIGRSLTCIVEGTRPLIAEIQALVIDNKFGNGRRTTQGFDQTRLSLLIAVIEKYLELPLSFSDVYINIAGGIKLSKGESDLAVIASILSSYHNIALNNRTLYLGEMGLTGEIKQVNVFEQRLREAEQLGYELIVTAKNNALEFREKSSLKIIGLTSIREVLRDLS